MANFTGRSGQIVADRYELLEVIGSGGQSIVYRARDRRDGDIVALKILGGQDPDAVERMFREALVMSQLQGTSAVRILHQAQTYDGMLALVMELLHGEELSKTLERREGEGVKADRAFVKAVFEPVARTLDFAHDRGIVHRDLKTENIFLIDAEHGGGVRLLDFGFAKLLRSPTITAAEVIAGSPHYLAPEVWTNGSWQAGPAADVWSLGIVLFRVLGGSLPFQGSPIELFRDVTQADRPSLHALRPDLSPDVDAWIAQVLAVDPTARFSKASGALRALLGCL